VGGKSAGSAFDFRLGAKFQRRGAPVKIECLGFIFYDILERILNRTVLRGKFCCSCASVSVSASRFRTQRKEIQGLRYVQGFLKWLIDWLMSIYLSEVSLGHFEIKRESLVSGLFLSRLISKREREILENIKNKII